LKLQASIARESQILLDLDILANQLLALIVSIILEVIALITSIVLEATALIASTILKKQLSLDRPEVLIQAYLIEKTAWLA
jgi:hypothetical protein